MIIHVRPLNFGRKVQGRKVKTPCTMRPDFMILRFHDAMGGLKIEGPLYKPNVM